jgi:CheY-like chemotaxis protein
VKFTPKGGSVTVALKRVSSHVEIAVNDDGAGISADFLPYVFDRFRQADSSIRRRHGGLGLGLAIVKQLVELHGGTVRVQSEGEGKGATFTVNLPVAVPHEKIGAPVSRDVSSTNGAGENSHAVDLTGLKVLVVDDEPDACRLIKWVLTECHAEVVTASSAIEAVPLAESARPDILISDLGMPEIDGYELLRRIRALGPARGGKVPAIAVSAFARPEDRARSLRAGFAMHMSKPIQPNRLTATVARLAGRTLSEGYSTAEQS